MSSVAYLVGALAAYSAKEGIELAVGMVVVLRGTIDLYRAKGELSLIRSLASDVTALLGPDGSGGARLLRVLEDETGSCRNAAIPLPPVAVHVGPAASPGTEGCRDFWPAARLGTGISHT